MRRPRLDWQPISVWLLAQVLALPYSPSLRWAFYRIMDRFGLGKSDWHRFKCASSRWRKNELDGWAPDTLMDSVRSAQYRGFGQVTEMEWRKRMIESSPLSMIYNDLDFYVEVWFESKAMSGRFEYYLAKPFRITMRPFRGDYTIPMKWETAKHIDRMCEAGKKVYILYFGDADAKGEIIPTSALKDIRKWCKNDFEFIIGGLTAKQATDLKLPENFERPGQWQWDALTDKAAGKIIMDTIKSNVNTKALASAVKKAEAREKRWRASASKALEVS